MASVFKNAPSTGSQNLTASNQVVYGPVPGATTAIVFDGTVANIDSSLLDQQVTVSVLRTDGTTYDTVLYNVTIPYGASLQLPKIVLMTNEKLCMTPSNTSNKLAAKISLVELS